MRTRSRITRATLAVGATTALLFGAAAPSFASSHREAPLTAADPQIDSTDLYVFVSPDAPDTVTVISNWIPFEQPAGGPNFYLWGENVHYDVHIDNNGDAKADVTYRWTFKTTTKNSDTFLQTTGPVTSLSDATLNVAQTYTLERIDGSGRSQTVLSDAPAAPSNVGKAAMPDYAKLRREAIVPLPGGKGKSFVGQADDPFFLDLRIFDLLYGTNLSEGGNDTLDGYNVNTMALQVPKTDLVASGDAAANPIIGIWTTASRPSTSVLNENGTVQTSGDFVQVSRLGNPLVNEVVVPLQFKNAFNGSQPDGDAQFLPKVQDPEVPKLIQSIYNIQAPPTPRNDLVSVFLTGVDGLNKPANGTPSEVLRLNTSIAPTVSPNKLGVIGGDNAGFPNGRRLSDDVVDIALQVMMGELTGTPNDLSDKVDANDVAFDTAFPYLASPHSGSDAPAAAAAGSQSSSSGVAAPATSTASKKDDGLSTPLVAILGGVAGVVIASGAFVLGRRRTSA